MVVTLDLSENRTRTTIDSLKNSAAKYDASVAAGKLDAAHNLALGIYGNHTVPDGRALIEHCIEAADILTSYNIDVDTLAAAILMGAGDAVKGGGVDIESTGPETARLVKLLGEIDVIHFSNEQRDRAAQLHQMMVGMSKDVRLPIVKLAGRLDLMRHIKSAPVEGRENFAQETLDIYTPLAHRLGLSQLKSEMEDLCFSILFPEEYSRLDMLAGQTAARRDEALHRTIEMLKDIFKQHDLKVYLSGRTKRLYSTHQKMLRQGKEFNELYDLAAVRIITNTVEECYRVLALLHVLWTPVLEEFDNYIAVPKQNGYQSIHTVVIAPNDQPVEIQIRTWEMHMRAEYGIAAHFSYKESTSTDRKIDSDGASWVRQVADETKRAAASEKKLIDEIVLDAQDDKVFALTPKGKVVGLPAGSTAIDFAYGIHTEVGHTCRGVKINGRIATIDQELRNGDVVEIITQKGGAPSRDWLRFVRSQQARSKIRAWFKKVGREENITHGRSMLQRELSRSGLKRGDLLERVNWNDILRAFNMKTEDDLHASVGCGDISIDSVIERIRRAYKELLQKEEASKPLRARTTVRRRKQDVIVEGLSDVMVSFPKCCFPAPCDDIVGFVTRNRGLAIHRTVCPNVRQFVISNDRIVKASWADTTENLYIVEIEVNSFDRVGALQAILAVISGAKINVVGVNSKIMKNSTALTTIGVEISNIEDLSRILPKISRIDDVLSAIRKI
jgi:GTP diphosphokinase / guanosine-3',5'-bis(diphosphate) 3'-diphosphatase